MPSILIVDDEPMICKFLSFRYQKEGYETLTANNGKDALAICKNNSPDVIITDMQMPESTGMQFLEDLRNVNDYNPIIVCMTAYPDLALQDAYDMGFSAVFNKPFMVGDIIGATRKFLKDKETYLENKNEDIEMNIIDTPIYDQITLISELSAGIIHNINNHIAYISGSSYLLKKHLEEEMSRNPEDEAMKNSFKYAEKIFSHSDMISKIIKSIKMLAYPNNLGIKNEKVKLLPIIENTKYLLEDNLKANDIKLNINCNQDIEILAYPELLIQVFLNLIKNSCEAIIDQKLEEKWVNIDVFTNESMLEISIMDSGKGIKKDIIPKLMKPFYTTKNREKGIGLGLSISKKLIEFQNGSIRLDESLENTRFVISFKIE